MDKKNINRISILCRCISLILPLIILLGSIIVSYFSIAYNDDVYIKYFYMFLNTECIYLLFAIILYINSKNKTIKKISKIFVIIACCIVGVQVFTIGKFKTDNDIIVDRILHAGSIDNTYFKVNGHDLKKIINKVNKMGKGDLILSNENIEEDSYYDFYMKAPFINKVIIEEAKSDEQNIGQYDKIEE